MATVEERIRQLAAEHFSTEETQAVKGIDLDANWADIEIGSAALVSFIILVNKEFNVTILPEDLAKFSSTRDLISHLEANAG